MKSESAVAVIVIMGVLSGSLAVFASVVRSARSSAAPGLALASIITSAVPITVGMLVTFVLRRHAEAEVWLSTSAVERELLRAQSYVSAELIEFGRFATLPGLLIGTLAWTRFEHRGSRAGGWLLACIVALMCVGSFSFGLRAPPSARYPLDNRTLWNLAIAIDKKDCDGFDDAIHAIFREGPLTLPPEFAGWPRLAEACVRDELADLESGPLSATWFRRYERLQGSALIGDQALRLRAHEVWPVDSELPVVSMADERMVARIKAELAPLWPDFEQCLTSSGATTPVNVAFIVRRNGIEELQETSRPAHPEATRCIAGKLVHLNVTAFIPVRAEFSFRKD